MGKKGSFKYLIIVIPVILVCAVLLFIICPVWFWLQYDVKAIDVDFREVEDDIIVFDYEGRTYRQIDLWNKYYVSNTVISKECIGRAKGTSVVLYTLNEDADKTVIVGENPVSDVRVFSCKYDAIPKDGEVTDAYVELGIPGVHGEGSMHLTIKKEEPVGENLNLFQRFWTNRYDNTPIEYVDPFSMDNEVVVECFLFFDNCPLAGIHVYITRQNGEWYYVEEERGSERNGEMWEKHWGYPIDDVELIEYLNEFMKYEEF